MSLAKHYPKAGTFGRLTILGFAASSARGERRYSLRCSCGGALTADAWKVVNGHTKSCGCIKREGLRRKPIKPGERFGRLVAISTVGKIGSRHYKTLFRCDCGNTHVAQEGNVRSGNTLSCGCLHDEMLVGQRYTLKHGHARDFKVTREYRSWDAMKSRCLRPSHKSYANYGGCGIRVCSRWLNSFKDFFADMGPRPKGTTLDRERPDGNYTPKNCRWANPKIQSNNKRKKRTKHGKAKQ